MVEKEFYKSYLDVAFMIFLIGFFLWAGEIGNSNSQAINLIKQNPSILILLILPVFFVFFIIFKGYTKKEIGNFLKKKLLKYLSRFFAFGLLAYVSIYIIIPYETTNFLDFIIFLVIIFSLFLLFVFISRFEEESLPEITKKRLLKVGKVVSKILVSFLVPTAILGAIYLLITKDIKISFWIAYLHSTFIICSLSTSIKNKRRIIGGIILVLVFNPILIWLSKQLIPSFQTKFFSLFLISGAIITILSIITYFLIHKKKCFRDFTKELYYQRKKPRKKKILIP